ncbi:MAG TPA: hypothetical protein VIG55_11295 [Methylosinus sp.]|jgi:hypothetical protein
MRRRTSVRSNEGRRRFRLLRRFAAALVILLLSLQGPARIGGGGAPTGMRASAGAMQSMGCARGADEKDGPRRHNGDLQCCALCGARSLDDAFALAPDVANADVRAPHPPLVTRVARYRPRGAAAPLGWRSSWSSRAPPSA